MEALLIIVVLAGAYVAYRAWDNGKKYEEAASDGATHQAQEAEAPYKLEPPTLNEHVPDWPFPTAVGVRQETAKPAVKKKASAKKTTAVKKAAPAKKTAAKKPVAAKKAPAKKTKSTK